MTLWGGRFSGPTDAGMKRFNDSLSFDRRLYAVDIRGSMAYARALQRAGLLTADEQRSIQSGLEQILAEFAEDRFAVQPSDEDIHTAVERRLMELIGSPTGKLHTGRSRNDQVAVDICLWLMENIQHTHRHLAGLQAALIHQAETHTDLIMPGYTHLQPAQPVLFSHWIMSYFWMFERDQERLEDCAQRAAVCPLGAGALAGNPFPIDREALAADLGMVAVTANSMDAVSNRDHIAEFLFCAALIGVHLSRLAEDLILFSSPGYRFVRLDEAYTTGSSLMPQKRNPDSLELARGKSGRLIGDLVGLLTVLKGIPSTYDKDLQEDKEPLFDAVDTLDLTLPVVTGVIGTLTSDGEAMRAALDPSMLATDLAEYLVERAVPFRDAHHVVGRLVRRAEEQNAALSSLSLEDFRAESAMFAEDITEVFDYARSISRRKGVGGTARESVLQQIAHARERLALR